MNWFWLNVPLMVVISAAVTGIPLWLVLTRPDFGPEPADQAAAGEQVGVPGPGERAEPPSASVLAAAGGQRA